MRIFHTTSAWIIMMLSLAVILTSCAEQNLVRGHLLRQSQLQQLQPGVSTTQDVVRVLGTPTVVPQFDDTRWLYIGQRRVRDGFIPPQMRELQIYMLDFDDSGILQKVDYQDHRQMQLLEYNKNRTVTRGSQLTVMQQLLGNLGRFESTEAASGGVRDLLQR